MNIQKVISLLLIITLVITVAFGLLTQENDSKPATQSNQETQQETQQNQRPDESTTIDNATDALSDAGQRKFSSVLGRFVEQPERYFTTLVVLVSMWLFIIVNIVYEQINRIRISKNNSEGFKAYSEVANPWKANFIWIIYLVILPLTIAPFWTTELVIRGADWFENSIYVKPMTPTQVDGPADPRWYRMYQQHIPHGLKVGKINLTATENQCLTFDGYAGKVGREVYIPRNNYEYEWVRIGWKKNDIPLNATHMRFMGTSKEPVEKLFTGSIIVTQWRKNAEGTCPH